MLINEVGGVDISTDTFATAPTVKELYKAGGAIAVGQAVILDSADPTGKTVATLASATEKHASAFVGIYSGVGGSGATSTATNLSGKDAVSGDMILLVTQGVTYAIAGGTVAAVDQLKLSTTAGRVYTCTVIASDNYKTIGSAMEAATVGVAFRIKVN